jgi:hypothetical protein
VPHMLCHGALVFRILSEFRTVPFSRILQKVMGTENFYSNLDPHYGTSLCVYVWERLAIYICDILYTSKWISLHFSLHGETLS